MIVSSISNAVENYIPVYVTENVLARVRFEFMEVLLRQNIEWFETNHCEEATSRPAEGTIQMSLDLRYWIAHFVDLQEWKRFALLFGHSVRFSAALSSVSRRRGNLPLLSWDALHFLQSLWAL